MISVIAFLFGFSFGDPVERMRGHITNTKIIAYELQWMVKPLSESEEGPIRALIYSVDDARVCGLIQEAMSDAVSRGGSKWVYIGLVPYGILTLMTENKSTVAIGISSEGFCAYNDTATANYFFSEKLSRLASDLGGKSGRRGELVILDGFFRGLAQRESFKY